MAARNKTHVFGSKIAGALIFTVRLDEAGGGSRWLVEEP
jgi:hypothetical protein